MKDPTALSVSNRPYIEQSRLKPAFYFIITQLLLAEYYLNSRRANPRPTRSEVMQTILVSSRHVFITFFISSVNFIQPQLLYVANYIYIKRCHGTKAVVFEEMYVGQAVIMVPQAAYILSTYRSTKSRAENYQQL